MKYKKIEKFITDFICEQQLKLGYDKSTVSLYIPLSSLNNTVGLKLNEGEMRSYLMQFCLYARERLGMIEISNSGYRFCITIPPRGSEYVYKNRGNVDFLCDFINTIAGHGCKIEDLLAVCKRYSSNVAFEEINNGEFNYLLYFKDGKPDSYRYCIADEGCHLIYHRFSAEDLEEMFS